MVWDGVSPTFWLEIVAICVSIIICSPKAFWYSQGFTPSKSSVVSTEHYNTSPRFKIVLPALSRSIHDMSIIRKTTKNGFKVAGRIPSTTEQSAIMVKSQP
ncbi:uncharacterized protein EAF01_003904 [Botrytis porri]|uniref:uncharacterized protein n=1 Tax=Botrytis porri TaxID=87229 RepID=UPI001900FDFA|nr:uncharacterized protein EAF01_003904 [Botrytis porri]KAF7908149.1 hypothetical protein EAF01_003904 [Botrytis porri]